MTEDELIQEQIQNWYKNITSDQRLTRIEGTVEITSEDILTLEEVYEKIGIDNSMFQRPERPPVFAFSGENQSTYEKTLVSTMASSTKPVITPPTPITSLLVEAIGWYPDARSLGLVEHTVNGVFQGYILMVDVREINGGPAQARRFELRHFDLRDDTRYPINMWYTNDYYTRTTFSEPQYG